MIIIIQKKMTSKILKFEIIEKDFLCKMISLQSLNE